MQGDIQICLSKEEEKKQNFKKKLESKNIKGETFNALWRNIDTK